MKETTIFSKISIREKEVIKLLSQGLTSNQIALELNISPKTVTTHRNNARLKLNCKNCPELISKAYQLGLL
jgi:DNA-binding CsgD family transcriptional regulator